MYCLMVGYPGLVFKRDSLPKTGGSDGNNEIELLPTTHHSKQSRQTVMFVIENELLEIPGLGPALMTTVYLCESRMH